MKTFRLATRPSVKDYDGEPVYCVEQKYDGWRLTAIRMKTMRFFSRKENITEKIKKQEKILHFVNMLPINSVIEMEIYWDFSTDVPTRLAQGLELRFSIFACPVLGGENLRKLEMPEYIKRTEGLIERFIVYDKPEVLDRKAFETLAEKNQCEGYVAKLKPYEEWYKIKPIRTIDLIVSDWYEGTKRNHGKLGGLGVSLFDGTPMGTINGFTDEQRLLTKKDVIGRVVEIEYDSLTKKNKLRFAQFIRFRDDKPAQECDGKEIKQKEK